MIDELLKEKYRVQADMAREAAYDIPTFTRQTQEAVRQIQKRYGFTINYVEAAGGYLNPMESKRNARD